MAVERSTEPRELIRNGDEYLVPLTRGLFARIDVEDGELVGRYRWNATGNTKGTYVASSKNVEGKYCQLSSLVMGATSRRKLVYLDGDQMNCHKSNLSFTKGEIRTEGLVSYIPLTKGMEAIIDSCELHRVKDFHWYASCRKGIFYAVTAVDQVGNDMARILFPEAERITYLTDNRLDCRRESLYLENRPEIIIEGDVAIIPLAKGKTALIDVKNLDKVLGVNRDVLWQAIPSGRAEYATTVDSISMHRLIMDAPDDKVVDHINGDGLDNREVNLRLVSRQENSWNRNNPIRSTTGITGVTPYGDKFIAYLKARGISHYLGIHSTLEEAAAARRAAELEHFGEFAPVHE
jgi:hypothetical protein